MIHVIEFVYPNCGLHFALLDTVRDRWITLNQQCMWDCWEDFKADSEEHVRSRTPYGEDYAKRVGCVDESFYKTRETSDEPK